MHLREAAEKLDLNLTALKAESRKMWVVWLLISWVELVILYPSQQVSFSLIKTAPTDGQAQMLENQDTK